MARPSLNYSLITLMALSAFAAACTKQTQPAAAYAEDGVDAIAAMRGLDYARENCASCHAVEGGGQASPNASAPQFEAVANAPGMNATALNAWLHSAHPSMPNLAVDPAHIANLAAYIETLRRGKARG